MTLKEGGGIWPYRSIAQSATTTLPCPADLECSLYSVQGGQSVPDSLGLTQDPGIKNTLRPLNQTLLWKMNNIFQADLNLHLVDHKP